MDNNFEMRRLVYNKSEDLYFIAYNVLLLLHHLKCTNSQRQFNDYRKLVFLISIISDEKKTAILTDYYKEGITANKNIRTVINRLYYESIEHLTLIRYLLVILEKKGVVKLVMESNKTNVFIENHLAFSGFFENERFTKEKNRIEKIQQKIPRIRSINYMTFIDNFFKRNGVAIWENS